MARFLGDEECPPRSGMQSVMGSAVWGGGFFEQQVIFLKPMFAWSSRKCVCPSRLSYSSVLDKS